MRPLFLLSALLAAPGLFAADQAVTIRFRAQVGDQPFACGRQYDDIGATHSKITGRDFRFYISNVRLTDAAGKETSLQLDQDGKWQLDDLALLDFENATAGCSNGTPDLNDHILGKVPEGRYTGLRFTLGVPFALNHTDLLAQPSPLNLTAMFWVWNGGHKFARLDFSSTGSPRGFIVHLGSTGCTPSDSQLTVPASCKSPNRVEVSFPSFDPRHDAVIADLGALLHDTNVDASPNKTEGGMRGGTRPGGMGMSMAGSGCMSGPTMADCAGVFANLGLPFGDRPAGEQKFFRLDRTGAASSALAAER